MSAAGLTQQTTALDVGERFAALGEKLSTEYNFEHFGFRHLLADVQRTLATAGIPPGEKAPDFELPQAGGRSLRLSELRGWPVLLHFGSFT